MNEQFTTKNLESLTENQQRLVNGIFEIQGIIFGNFKLHSGKDSPYYCDVKYLIEFPEFKKLAVQEYYQLLSPLRFEFDLIAPIPDGATSISSSIADSLDVGSIVPRLRSKSYGLKSPIIGLPEAYRNKNIALIDDVITEGDSAIEIIEFFTSNNLTVNNLAILVDRQEGGIKKIEKKTEVKVHSVFTISQLIDYGYRTEKLSEENYRRFKNYLTSQKTI